MISTDLKADVKQQETQELVAAISFIFYRSTLASKLEIQCNQACIFHLILLGIPYPAWSCPLRTGVCMWEGGRGVT